MPARRNPSVRVGGCVLLCSIGWTSACGPTDPTEPSYTPQAVAISISPPSATLGSLFETATFAAEVTDQNGWAVEGAAVTWSSDTPSVFSVDGSGVVTPVGNGSGTVRAVFQALSAAASVTVAAPAEEVALVALYNATGGPDWTENAMWLTDAPRRGWHGVVTDDNDRIVELRLPDNGLDGSIPAEINGLADLRVLDLSANGLTGPIPPEMGQLANLERLYLFENDLTGSIPPETGRLANLTVLDLFSNGLTGPIPPEVGDLAALEYLYLTENSLTGLVPREVGKLGNLKVLDLSANGLRGPVPPEVGQIAFLEWIVLEDNSEMSGELPAGLTALTLDGLHLGGTGLCAPRDAEFQAWLHTILFSRVADC